MFPFWCISCPEILRFIVLCLFNVVNNTYTFILVEGLCQHVRKP